MQSARWKRLFGDRKFYSMVLAVALPIMAQNGVTNFVSMLDNIMVGQLGTEPMSGVAIANQLLFVFNLCIFGATSGAGIFGAQFYGSGDTDGLRSTFQFKLLLCAGLTVLAIGILMAFPEPLIRLYLHEGGSAADIEATLQYGLDYVRVMLWGLFPFMIVQVYSSTLRETGQTIVPMVASMAAILVNLTFNYFLIFGRMGFPRLEVRGAAIATVLSRFVELAVIAGWTHAHAVRNRFVHGVYRKIHIPGRLAKQIFVKGMPLMYNEILWAAGTAILNQCYSVRGLDVVAACNIATTVSNLFKVVFLSMGNAVAIMVGQALGANDIERAKNCTWRLMTAAVGSNLFMSILLILFAPSIPHIYNTEPHVRQIATQLLYVIAMMMPAYSFSHCCYFTLRSGGKTIITFLFDSVFTWCVNVPTAWLLAYRTGMGIVPLYFCVQALELIKVVIGFALVKKGVWIHNIVAPVTEKEAAEK